MIKKYFVFWIMLVFGLCYWLIIPRFIDYRNDTGYYIKMSYDLSETLVRPIGYPFLIKIARFLGDFYTILTLVNVLMFASIMQTIYLIRKNYTTLTLLIITGCYYLYIPFILTDLTFAFLCVWSFYFLIKKQLYLHILFIGLSALVRPTTCYFWVVEPFLIWFIFKDKRLVLIGTIICFFAVSILSFKNLFESGVFASTTILQFQIDNYTSKAANPLLYPIISIFSNSVSTHWFEFFKILGFYKRDLNELKQLNFLIYLNYFFIIFYITIFAKFLYQNIKQRNYVYLFWVGYFTLTCIACAAIGGRHRMSFEFLIY